MPAISWLYIIKKQESHVFLISRQFHIMLPFVHGYNCHESCFFLRGRAWFSLQPSGLMVTSPRLSRIWMSLGRVGNVGISLYGDIWCVCACCTAKF